MKSKIRRELERRGISPSLVERELSKPDPESIKRLSRGRRKIKSGVTFGKKEYWKLIAHRLLDPLLYEPISHLHAPPVGSPYGFDEQHWETVLQRWSQYDVLYVVLAYQFKSDYYDSEHLKDNVECMFLKAVNDYNRSQGSLTAKLEFHPLTAGYGEHLLNEIALDIISSDIGLFDTSDHNPNVMIEMGIALTWGVPLLPIRAEQSRKLPSDISGHTWASYQDSGREFVNPKEHQKRLVQMTDKALRRKILSNTMCQ